jgi:hypothetical protein
MTTHTGSCHCGKIAFEVKGEFDNAMVCNCSYCRRAGHMLAFVGEGDFRLTTPQKDVANYLFNKQVINHYHCTNCGIATHGGGVAPDGTRMVAVNLRCVDGIDLDGLTIQKYDGAKL